VRELETIKDKDNISVNCTHCGKLFHLSGKQYKKRMRNNKSGLFCSVQCINTNLSNRNRSAEIIARNRAVQLGVSVLSRGRTGHIVSEETREKIRLKKLGKPAPVDTQIILNELKFRKAQKYFAMVGLIPDAIFFEDGKPVALEVQKSRWDADIRKKMAAYNNRPEYEKVVLVWYSPSGKRLKEWHKDNGEWKLISS
jgi:hypothetical protein